MIRVVLSLVNFTVAFATTSATYLELPLLVAATKARFSNTVPVLDSNIALGTAILSQVPLSLRACELLSIQDAEELCSGMITQLYVLAAHREKFKTSDVESSMLKFHRRLLSALDEYESSVKIGCPVIGKSAAEIQVRICEVAAMKSNIADARKLIKSKRSCKALDDCINRMKLLFPTVDKLETVYEERRAGALKHLLCRPLDQVMQNAADLVSAVRKLMVLQFQAEMQHLRILRRPRHYPQDKQGMALAKLVAIREFKISISATIVYGRRLDILLPSLGTFMTFLREKFAEGRCNDTLSQMIELLYYKFAIPNQEAYLGLVCGKLPDHFPVTPSILRRQTESAIIQDFIAKYLSFAEAERGLALLL